MGRKLAGRFVWLLETMCELQGIDVQEIDDALDFWENKAEIESKFGTKLVLDLSKLEERTLESMVKYGKPVEAAEFMEAVNS